MKGIRHIAVAGVLGFGLVSAAQAHVFVGVGVGLPVAPVVPVVAVRFYAPPPTYYVAPAPVYAPPTVVAGYWGAPHPSYGRYYGYGYWR
ncbi:hypothetical protein J8I87_23125 [Paraburkholderia sp. LEh10]|uniref:hypothetical protein n=1 Tax=Paraburkholderia sp. LEh10 TaxID=2821353 RepID=UPI001AE29F4A|nr:hypothetical protein [Paraburkholderia sp. LEh10]MBP0592576.1 hypothetical protein [Paraburkholderia sp. LEh10]